MDKCQIIQDRVFRQRPQLTGCGQKFEVIQSDKLTAKDTVPVIVLDKCHIDTGKRHIVEHKEKDHCRYAHKKQCPIPYDFLPESQITFTLFHSSPSLSS